MRSFLEFFLETVAISELGLSSSMQDLPLSKPYGFWMDRHGNFIKGGSMDHSSVAASILERMGESVTAAYDQLFEKGWVRVFLSNKILYWENSTLSFSLSNIQRRNLLFISDYYDLEGVVGDNF